MATKKTSAPAKAGGKSKALIPWETKFAAYAKQTTEQVKDIGGGIGIGFGHNDITVAGNSVGKTIEVIIMGSTPHNKWFKTGFDKDNKQPPDCYAFAPLDSEHPGLTLLGTDPNMAPHAAVKDKQSDKCCDCEKNVFGTATVGKGKACANTLRLGLVVAKDIKDGDSARSAEIATAGVSPTNLKHYKKYVDMLESDKRRPPWAVITEITSHDDKATQIRLEFKLVDLIEDDEILIELEKRFLKVQDELQKPYPTPTDDKKAPSKSAGVGKSSKFAGAKKK
jgi:hypothetical protein